MIRAFQPDAKKIGILYNTAEANSMANLTEIKKLAPNYGFEIVEKGVQSAADIPAGGRLPGHPGGLHQQLHRQSGGG